MRLDLYQAECVRIANEQLSLIKEAQSRIASGHILTNLEQSGLLHVLQVLVKNAIGKSKHLLKSANLEVPVSAYDALASLVQQNLIPAQELQKWNAIIGLRNRIVHDYMNIDMGIIFQLISTDGHRFVADFLRKPIT